MPYSHFSKASEDFVKAITLKFFEMVELTSKFLTEIEPAQWEQNDEFKKAISVFRISKL